MGFVAGWASGAETRRPFDKLTHAYFHGLTLINTKSIFLPLTHTNLTLTRLVQRIRFPLKISFFAWFVFKSKCILC